MGRYNADGGDESEVVSPEYRMPDAKKQALSESLRKLTAHSRGYQVPRWCPPE